MEQNDVCERDPATRERAFYRRLLDLGGQVDLEPLLDEALSLIVEVTGASTAYLELYDDDGAKPRFWRSNHCSDAELATIRDTISRGIIARAVAEGATIESMSAQGDLARSYVYNLIHEFGLERSSAN